jgi:rhodanese-related sulfurtransferase
MPGCDRLFSLRTLLQAGGIIVAASAIAFAANGMREKQVDLGRQYFPAAVIAAKPREGSTATKPPAPLPPAEPSATGADPRAPVDPAAIPAELAKPVAEPSLVEEPPADGIQRMSLEDCRDLVASPVAVFVDARDRDFYIAGHIPGAVHLHHYDSAKHIEEVRPILEAAFMVIVYCNGGDCEDSINLALDLVTSYGIPNENVQVFEGGMDEWKAAGLPVVAGENRE